MSPVYAPADITRANNNSSPQFNEFNGQTAGATTTATVASAAASAAAVAASTKSFPNYFNNHISNGEILFFLDAMATLFKYIRKY